MKTVDFSETISTSGSLLPVFGVRVSVTFHLTCVHIILVRFAESPPFGK